MHSGEITVPEARARLSRLLMIRYEDLEEKVCKYHPEADVVLLRKAYVFSAREHRDQIRQSGEPYLSHPLQVADILAEMKLDVACVSVGLLHDVVEDTLTTLETIREYFGEDIAHLVDGVTKISKIRFSSRQERQAENFRKLILAMVDDIRVIMVKLADRLHNLRTLQHLPEEKRKIIAQETLDIYVSIAHRLGMAKLRSEMEDLAFENLDPVAFRTVSQQVERKRANSEQFSQEVMQELRERFAKEGIEAQIESRIKRIYSTHQKMKRQRIGIDQVYDFVAIRVLVPTVSDCYRVLGIVNNTWSPVPGRIKDFIAMPRPNQYQSLHTTVVGHDGRPFELQIRTREMDRVAEQGIAAHWKYKEGKVEDSKEDQRFSWLRQLLEWQHEVQDPHEFLSNLKIDLYPEAVYSFTPKGEVITLPRGATPVDFAFAIHTEVGHKTVGARVNGRIVPLKYKLRNGEIVEIMTSKEARPSRDWLDFVKTSRARSSIRRWINQRKKEEAVVLGERLLEREARKYKLNLRRYETQQLQTAAYFKARSWDKLLVRIGLGEVSAEEVLLKLDPETVLSPPGEEQGESRLTRVVSRVLRRSDPELQVSGRNDVLVYRAKCCNPIRGEEVIGYLTMGRGISVHSVDCPKVQGLLLDPEKKIKVGWSRNADGEDTSYSVRLLLNAEDRTGILAEIISTVSEADTNIVNVSAGTVDNRYGLIDMTLEVSDVKHLEVITNQLKAIEGIQDVERDRDSGSRKDG